MSIKNTSSHYGSVSKIFHWLIFFLILGLLIVGSLMEDIDDESLKGLVYMIHKSTGMTVLALVVLRTVWALINQKPRLPGQPARWERVAEKGGHYLLYILMFAMPLSGWIMSTAAAKAPNVFGLFELPFPGIVKDKPLMKLMGTTHYLLAWTIVIIVALHILAALKHHYINKDNVLKRMMP